MALSYKRYAFGLSACDFWPSLSKGHPMPEDCKSRHNQKTGRTGLGLVEAASFLLTGAVRLGREGDAFSVAYTSNRGGTSVASSAPGTGAISGSLPSTRVWRGTNRMKAPALLCLVEAALLTTTAADADPELEEVAERWAALLEEIELRAGHTVPFSKAELQEADGDTLCRRRMMALTDSVYFALDRADANGWRVFEDDGGEEYAAMPAEDRGRLFGLPPVSARPASMPSGAVSATLGALIATGGTALLVGPTGTFKTTTATRAALGAGAALQVLKGRPGIEDRDFLGSVVPTASGPAWIDGPITKAFKRARTGPTVLLMDEILRLEPLFLGALVGLLDPASPAELAARGIAPAAGFEDERHFVAALPTGEEVACPTSQFTLIATTNMGHDYVQAAQLDAALKGRFELTVEVDRPDPGVKRHLYQGAGSAHPAGGPAVADMLEAIERAVADEHIDQGGLLPSLAHPRLMLNMTRHLLRLTEAGTDAAEAAVTAARHAVAPNVAQRQPSGALDAAGVEVVLEAARTAAKKHLR